MVSQLINSNGNATANQFVISHNDGTIGFQSYAGLVCEVRPAGLGFDKVVCFGRDWDYSRTTMKHLVTFLRQNGCSVLGCAKDIREAIDRGHARYDEAIAVLYDETMR